VVQGPRKEKIMPISYAIKPFVEPKPRGPVAVAVSGYQTVRERIKALEADIDEQTLADTLEGLTDLNEILAAVVRSALIDEAMAEGLKGHIDVLRQRLQRLTETAGRRRQIVRDAMVEAGLKKVAAPDLTVSIRSGSPALVVVDEKAIPGTYWQPRDPRLDRLGLLTDLKRGMSVDGVELSNPEPVLSVRVR
jgi:hypothetical protein